jgi:hypothetical protein
MSASRRVDANLWLVVPVAAILVLAVGSQLGGPATVLRIAVAAAALTVIAGAAVALSDVRLGVTIAGTVVVASAASVVLSLPNVDRHLRSPSSHDENANSRSARTASGAAPTPSPTTAATGAASPSAIRVHLVGAQLPGADLRNLVSRAVT